MKTSEIKLLSERKLKNPTFLMGLFDQYAISDIVIETLIEHTKAEKFAELYSPSFPDYIISEENGILHLPRYDFYASERFDPNIILMTGEVRPDIEDTKAHYEVFDQVFNLARELGCRRFISFGTFLKESAEDKIYIAATQGNLVSLITRTLGGKPFSRGSIDGLIGLILGFANLQKLPAICILGPTSEDAYQQEIAHTMFQYILQVLKLKVD
ncbi:PAC2 family protein [Candidatus Bathyarchaeota archaeon]|nr:PAC2 family protein [Candidatus Bathyarchaeota archaeon]